MRFRGDIEFMPGERGPGGLCEAIIYYDDNEASIVEWRYFETVARNLPYEECNIRLSKRLNELNEQHRTKGTE